MCSKSDKKIPIGRIETVGFPEWQITGLDAKIDTGAFTSSLHGTDIRCDAADRFVSFTVPGTGAAESRRVHCPIQDVRRVKSSNGMVEERVVVVGRIEIGGERYTVELTLTDRSDMRYPVLLGRRFIRNKFIVDVSKTYIRKNI